MKKALSTVGALLALILLCMTPDAEALNITIWDGSGVSYEDNEVEPNCVLAQKWDLERFYLNSANGKPLLTMVGGYDFKNGVSDGTRTYTTGDIFIDVNGDAKYGETLPTYSGGNNQISNIFGYDYAIRFDFNTNQFNVYQLTQNSALSVFFSQNNESNPWQYVIPTGVNPMYTGTLQYLQNIALTGEYAGLQGMSDSSVHNALTVDLGFLPSGTQFLAHYTYGCGNDNLMGKGTTVPEPGTILLLGSGLFGLAFARRRMKK